MFHSQVDKDLLLGEIYPFDPAHVVPTTIKLGTALKMAGIGLSDGARRWVQTGGTDYGCMPEAAVTEGGPLVDVRCRWGATTVAEQAGNKLIVKNASLAIEGFNPATGVTTWTVSLADPTGQSEEAVFNRIEVVGEHTLLVPAAHGEMLIDPTTGATRLAPADTAAVCLVAIQVPLAGGQRTVAGYHHQQLRDRPPGHPVHRNRNPRLYRHDSMAVVGRLHRQPRARRHHRYRSAGISPVSVAQPRTATSNGLLPSDIWRPTHRARSPAVASTCRLGGRAQSPFGVSGTGIPGAGCDGLNRAGDESQHCQQDHRKLHRLLQRQSQSDGSGPVDPFLRQGRPHGSQPAPSAMALCGFAHGLIMLGR